MYFTGRPTNPPRSALNGCACKHTATGEYTGGTTNLLVAGGLLVGGLLWLMHKVGR